MDEIFEIFCPNYGYRLHFYPYFYPLHLPNMSQHSLQDDGIDFDDVNESLPEPPTEKQIAHHKLCLKRWDDAVKYLDTKTVSTYRTC